MFPGDSHLVDIKQKMK